MCVFGDGAAGGWTPNREESGVKLYSMSKPGTPLVYTKGMTVIRCALRKFIDMTADVPLRKKWDPATIDAFVIDDVDPKTKVQYLLYKSPSMLVSNRDFVILRRETALENGAWALITFSTTSEKMPEKPDVVRADLLTSGFVAYPIDDNSIEVH